MKQCRRNFCYGKSKTLEQLGMYEWNEYEYQILIFKAEDKKMMFICIYHSEMPSIAGNIILCKLLLFNRTWITSRQKCFTNLFYISDTMLRIHILGKLMYHIIKQCYKFYSYTKKPKNISCLLLWIIKSKVYKPRISI